MSFVEPLQSRSIGKPEGRLSAQYGYDPSVPMMVGVNGGVGDAGAIRRKNRAHFLQVVIRELNRIALGQHLDVDLSWAGKRRGTANERDHAAIGGKRGLADRIWNIRDLHP